MDEARDLFERLIAEHQRDVLRVSRAITRDDHHGADAAQETFLRLWARLAQGVLPARPGAWLQRVAVSAALDVRRRERVRPSASLDSAELPADALGAHVSTPEARELGTAYERALSELSDGQRVVFLLRHEGGFALARVAELLDLALPTVKTHFARACLHLQRELRAFRDEPDERRP